MTDLAALLRHVGGKRFRVIVSILRLIDQLVFTDLECDDISSMIFRSLASSPVGRVTARTLHSPKKPRFQAERPGGMWRRLSKSPIRLLGRYHFQTEWDSKETNFCILRRLMERVDAVKLTEKIHFTCMGNVKTVVFSFSEKKKKNSKNNCFL